MAWKEHIMTDSTQEPGTTPDQPTNSSEANMSEQGSVPAPADASAPAAPNDAQSADAPSADAQSADAPSTDAQPTAVQPTAAWPAEPTSTQRTDAFGRPVQGAEAAAPGYAPHAAPQSYATAEGYPTQPVAPVATKDPKRKGSVALVAALAIGALVGGASGAGVTALVLSNQDNAVSTTQAQSPSNVVINNADRVNQITAVVAKASPSVVTIDVASGNSAGTGSGVILSADGYVLTNTHVVTLDGAVANPTIQVKGSDGKLYKAKIVGTDPTSDLAVIKLTNATGLKPIAWADSGKLNVGDTAVAIGAPLGLSDTVTTGIVSALNRSITVASSAAPTTPDQTTPNDGKFWNFDIPNQNGTQSGQATGSISLSVIQTDAAINPGNSGGALLNSSGELIGINVAIANASGSSSTAAGSIGVGFSIPSNLAKRISDALIADGKATHGLLGASVTDATNDATSTTVGALISKVTSGGAAEKAGLKAGDVVTVFNGVPITDANDLTAQVRALAAGSKVDLSYVRGGKSFTVSVTVGQLSN
jgi:putative serine protease PepD